MAQEICEVNMRFTGFEKLEELSMTQLQALKAHDWAKPVKEIWKVDDSFDQVHFTAIEDQPDKRHEPIRDKIAVVAEEGLSHEELVQWVKAKMAELDAAGKLAKHGVVWNDAVRR